MIYCRSNTLAIGNIQPDGLYPFTAHLFQSVHAPRHGEYIITVGGK